MIDEDIEHMLNPQALTALTLLAAESALASKDIISRLIVNLQARASDRPAGCLLTAISGSFSSRATAAQTTRTRRI
ncbi:MAG: hypothetical protein OXC54_02040 [Rhodospirillaceae bacterium]|nr:hypothetical protein [Rhodospirillaceae bacterium]MCY4238861.1 hypothetical protein [Rhodospirillaceae bacterium]MCY4310086.1 hypothetical protein [Rhodospirillaceae bacterium]